MIGEPRQIEGWMITASEQNDPTMRYRIVATHKTEEPKIAESMDLETALLWLAKKINVDRHQLKSLYGL